MGCVTENDDLVPMALYAKYVSRNLKSADALIAAYSEWVKAELLVSENRDFLALSTPLPFRVVKAAAFLREFAV